MSTKYFHIDKTALIVAIIATVGVFAYDPAASLLLVAMVLIVAVYRATMVEYFGAQDYQAELNSVRIPPERRIESK